MQTYIRNSFNTHRMKIIKISHTRLHFDDETINQTTLQNSLSLFPLGRLAPRTYMHKSTQVQY